MKRHFKQEQADNARSYISCIKRTADDYDIAFAYDYETMFHNVDRALYNLVYDATEEKVVDESISKLFDEAIPRILNSTLITEEDFTSIKGFEAKLKKIFEESVSNETAKSEYHIPESTASIRGKALLKQLEALA